MEYNNGLTKLIIPEYGRCIQGMVEYIVEVADREKRNRMAKTIVNLMAQMHPETREVGDVKRKLWDHLFIMSDFKLDVDAPYPKPEPQELYSKPPKLPYPENHITFKHYGKNTEHFIEKALLMEDGAEKDAFVKAIANHMKKSYLTWNRESVNDEVIYEHLSLLSQGRLKLSEDARLTNSIDLLPPKVKKIKFQDKVNQKHAKNYRNNWKRKNGEYNK
ncbi:MAG: DUF4290 domain-containing protein [Lentimicrobiaceae bacterium]|nr:DUF4290 domain-containing protein [Lentimicrobiaceae bacterium]